MARKAPAQIYGDGFGTRAIAFLPVIITLCVCQFYREHIGAFGVWSHLLSHAGELALIEADA